MIESATATATGIETEIVTVEEIGIEAITAIGTEREAETETDTARVTEIEIASKTAIETETVTATAPINLATLPQRTSRRKRRNPRLPPSAPAKR
jgi:hypothetical protein